MKPCRGFVLLVAAGAAILVSALEARQTPPAHYSLDSPEGLRLHNVTAEPAVLQGKKGLKVTISDQAQRQVQQMSDAQQASFEQLALVGNLEFSSGEISAEIAGAPGAGAAEGARGFVGIAFRVQSDLKTYEAFYLRPTNGRADDQERRNHAAQYVSHPDWPWFRLRKETPSRYEAYVDVQPATWTAIRIEVRGDHARLFVHGQDQPTLVVNDLKTGAQAKGAVALWLGPGTIAHFRELTVTPAAGK